MKEKNKKCCTPVINQFYGCCCNDNTDGGIPTGTILSYLAFEAPEGYLSLDGGVYNITDYPDLADHFKTKLGSINYYGGDGLTTFALPDARGEFIRGYDADALRDPDGVTRGVGNHQDATEHLRIVVSSSKTTTNTAKPMSQKYEDKTIRTNGNGNMWVDNSVVATNTATVDESYTSRPTNLNVLYCIKY